MLYYQTGSITSYGITWVTENKFAQLMSNLMAAAAVNESSSKTDWKNTK